MTTKCKVGTLVIDQWYGLGIVVSIESDKHIGTGGYKNKVKFFYGNQVKTNEYNDREIEKMMQNFTLATEKGYGVHYVEGNFNTRNWRA